MRNFERRLDRIERPVGYLGLVGLIAVLSGLTIVHFSGWDSDWSTENWMLFLSTTLVAVWFYPHLPFLVLGVAAISGWCGLDLIRDTETSLRLIRWAGRASLMALLIIWISRVRQMLDRAENLSRVDDLTGLPNRRALLESLGAEFYLNGRPEHHFSLAMIDCDQFKQVNDQQGHEVGDQVLRRLAQVLRENARDGDFVGRLGGDEFCLILPNVSLEQSRQVIDRLRTALGRQLGAEFPNLTYSIGVISVRVQNPSPDRSLDPFACLKRVDEVMYEAKHEGRDQTRYESIR